MLALNLQIILMSLQVMELRLELIKRIQIQLIHQLEYYRINGNLRDNGLVKSSRILIGNKIGVGLT